MTVEEALRYAMSLPVATTISGIDSLAVLRQNLAVARGFQPMTAEEMEALRERCAPAAGDGHLELYKSTMQVRRRPRPGAARLPAPQGTAAVRRSQVGRFSEGDFAYLPLSRLVRSGPCPM